MTAWLRQLATDATNESQALVDVFAHDSACEWIADHGVELALLCADMGDALADYIIHLVDCDPCDCENCTRNQNLLARLDALRPEDTA